MNRRRNPLFKRRPTPQEVAAYRQRGLMRVLVEKYPKWALEQGLIERKESPGFFSRLFGSKEEAPSIGVDEAQFRRSQTIRDRQRAQEAQTAAMVDFARSSTQGAGLPRPVAPQMGMAPPAAPPVVVEGAPAPGPVNANSLGAIISQRAPAEDIDAKIGTDAVQEIVEQRQAINEEISAPGNQASSQIVTAQQTASVAATHPAPREAATRKTQTATQQGTGKRAATAATDKDIENLLAKMGRAGKIIAYIKYTNKDNGKQEIKPLFLMSSVRGDLTSNRYVSALQAVLPNHYKNIVFVGPKLTGVGDPSRQGRVFTGSGTTTALAKILVQSKDGGTAHVYLARKGLFQKDPSSDIKKLAKKLVENWPKGKIGFIKTGEVSPGRKALQQIGQTPQQIERAAQAQQARQAQQAAPSPVQQTVQQRVEQAPQFQVSAFDMPEVADIDFSQPQDYSYMMEEVSADTPRQTLEQAVGSPIPQAPPQEAAPSAKAKADAIRARAEQVAAQRATGTPVEESAFEVQEEKWSGPDAVAADEVTDAMKPAGTTANNFLKKIAPGEDAIISAAQSKLNIKDIRVKQLSSRDGPLYLLGSKTSLRKYQPGNPEASAGKILVFDPQASGAERLQPVEAKFAPSPFEAAAAPAEPAPAQRKSTRSARVSKPMGTAAGINPSRGRMRRRR